MAVETFIFTPAKNIRVADIARILGALNIRLVFDRENPADEQVIALFEGTGDHWTPVEVQQPEEVA
jgi:hypothetical protein